MKKLLLVIILVIGASYAHAQMSRADSIITRRSAEVDFVVNRIENNYIFGRRGISEEEWNSRVQIVRDKILSVKLDSVSCSKYPYAHLYALRYFGLLVEDAHFRFPNSGQFSQLRVFQSNDMIFPVWVRTWTDGTVYCEQDYSGAIPNNARIVSVNGRSAQQMALHNREIYPGEPRAAMASMRGNRAFDPYVWTNFSNYLFTEFIRPPYYVEYIDYQGVTKTVQVQSMSRQDVQKAYRKMVRSRIDQRVKYGDDFYKFIQYKKVNDSIGLINVNMFWGYNILELMIFGTDDTFGNSLKNVMRRVARDKVRHLIVDFSRNAGGMTDNVYKMLNYFTDKPIERNHTYLLTKDNRQILRNVIASGDHRYMGITKEQLKEFQTLVDSLPDGTLFSTDILHNLVFTPTPLKHKYMGKTYLITGAHTFSTGQLFAQHFKNLDIGSVVGEPSGGYSSISGGNAAYVQLPYSHWMTFMVPYSRYGKKSDTLRFDYDAVDLPIEIKKEDWLNNRDKQATVAELIEMIKNSKIKAIK